MARFCSQLAASHRNRRGAIAPMFALLTPAVLIMCGLAVNVSYMQLTHTELKVAIDAASRAGGRALSEYQNIDDAIDYAESTAAANLVAGDPLLLRTEDGTDDIEFGTSQREDNGYGRYQFVLGDRSAIRAQTEEATSIRINGSRTASSLSGPINLLFRGYYPFGTYNPRIDAITTQVDRDIALVMDRSGSMAYYENELALKTELDTLYSDGDITYDEYRYAKKSIYNRFYYPNVVTQLSPAAAEYALGMNAYNFSRGPAPAKSRWAALDAAVDAFLDVLETTDQEERVSMATFASSATLDFSLSDDFNAIRTIVQNTRPYGATAIGQGMEEGLPAIIGSLGRPYAAKTIVIMTDGQNNSWPDPVDVAIDIVNNYNVVIHTVTFSDGAAQTAMKQVAAVGGGKHFHADDVTELVEIFEEIANNLPTVITK